MLSVYPACFIREKKGYSVVFPDLNYLATDGKNEKDAMTNAVDCLAGYLYVLEKDGDVIPKASEMKSISLKKLGEELEIELTPDNSFINMVSVDVQMYAKEHFEKSVRKTLTIPEWLNQAALKKNINFSQTLQEALISKLKA